VLHCDVTSLYPSIMLVYGYFPKKDQLGIFPGLLRDLRDFRIRAKEMARGAETEESRIYFSALQSTFKILINSFYGYLGFFGARWYSIESAKSVTAWGRSHIHKVIEKAKNEGFGVLYSDTDSVFMTLGIKSKNDAQSFAEALNVELPGLMELEYEGFYPAGIFVSAKMGSFGAKKKYALMSEGGTLKIKGFETVRRNWSLIAKNVQEKVLEIMERN